MVSVFGEAVMDRKSIVAFVAIYAIVAGVGFLASNRHSEIQTQPSAGTDVAKSLVDEGESPDTAISTTR